MSSGPIYLNPLARQVHSLRVAALINSGRLFEQSRKRKRAEVGLPATSGVSSHQRTDNAKLGQVKDPVLKRRRFSFVAFASIIGWSGACRSRSLEVEMQDVSDHSAEGPGILRRGERLGLTACVLCDGRLFS